MDTEREADLSDRMDAAAAEIADLRRIVERAADLRAEIDDRRERVAGLVTAGPQAAA